jgi:hypothetical protein
VAKDALVRIFRPGPRQSSGWGAYFNVRIDGADTGVAWSDAVRTINVTPGTHELRMRCGILVWSRKLKFTVESGQVIDFACRPQLLPKLPIRLHKASPEESLAIEHRLARHSSPDDPARRDPT